jgi:hypothetical protein
MNIFTSEISDFSSKQVPYKDSLDKKSLNKLGIIYVRIYIYLFLHEFIYIYKFPEFMYI